MAFTLVEVGALGGYARPTANDAIEMKYADKLGVRVSIVLGDSEIESGKANLKNMESGETQEIELSSISSYLK